MYGLIGKAEADAELDMYLCREKKLVFYTTRLGLEWFICMMEATQREEWRIIYLSSRPPHFAMMDILDQSSHTSTPLFHS